MATRGLSLDYVASKQLLSQFNVEQLQACYVNHCCVLSNRPHICRCNVKKDMLVDSLKRLPGLKSIEYHKRKDQMPLDSTALELAALGTLASVEG